LRGNATIKALLPIQKSNQMDRGRINKKEGLSKMETSARALIDHWSWAAQKGLMNRNTAGGLRSASSRVLEALGDNWEEINIAELDVEETLLRFQNLKKKDFLPQVLEEYKQRFRKAVRSYLDYLANSGTWKPAAQERPTAPQRNGRAQKLSTASAQPLPSQPSVKHGFDEIEYPFPLRSGVMARLILPKDLSRDDVSRLSAFMAMLVVANKEDSREK
jgi:hypothetical protein